MGSLVLRQLKALFVASWKESMAYRFDMLVSIFVSPVFFGVQYIVWGSVFGNTAGTIAGYTFSSMMQYFALSFLTAFIIWDETSFMISDQVRKGEYMMQLIKPISANRCFFFYKMGNRTMATLIEFVPVLLIFWFIFGIPLFSDLSRLPWYMASIALSFVLLYQVQFLMGMVSFFVVKADGLRRIVVWSLPFFSGQYFPLALLPVWIGNLFAVTPFPWIVFSAISVYLGGMTLGTLHLAPLEILGIQLAYCVVLGVFNWVVYDRALKRYSGVGA